MTATSPPELILSKEAAIAGLSGDDNQIRYYAAWWLGKHQVQEAWGVLCEALKDDRYRTPQGGYPLRRQAARALGQLKNTQAVPALLSVLNCEDLQLREAAIQALAAIGDSRAEKPLLELLGSEGEQPLEALIEALGTLQVWSAQKQIEAFLEHNSERVQCAAARYLYIFTKEPQYIERIIKNLTHPNMYLRWAAAFDLGSIGHIEAAEAIINAKVGNSLKLLNLKRILESVLSNDRSDEAEKRKTTDLLLRAIDDLLIQL
ncbi:MULTISPECIES: HEAT repeat domain-containing protein [Aerosakkonema]|uniref:HEAT repeat domain-containing protein n=1 Tax=Aerosakkonema TaxID=1246629 RepID=UPI0035B70209